MNWKIKKLLQSVTKPKIWAKPNPKLFSDTNFFRYRIRYFFRYQFFFDTDTDTFFDTKFFPKPIPILLAIPKNFETDTDTFVDTKNFRNRHRYHKQIETFWIREVSKPKCHTLLRGSISPGSRCWNCMCWLLHGTTQDQSHVWLENTFSRKYFVSNQPDKLFPISFLPTNSR